MAYIQIPEYKIRQTIEMFKDEYGAENPAGLIRALDDGDIIRNEGLTPFYILHEEQQYIITTSEEMMNNRLN